MLDVKITFYYTSIADVENSYAKKIAAAEKLVTCIPKYVSKRIWENL